MMDNKLVYSLGIISFLCLAILLIKNINKSLSLNRNQVKLLSMNRELENKDKLIKFLTYSATMGPRIDNMPINPTIELYDFNGHHVTLDKAIDLSPKLILRIPEKACNSCFENFFESLSQIEYEKLKNNLIVIVRSSQLKKYYSLFNKIEPDFKLYGVNSRVHKDFDDRIFPYLFIVDSSFRIYHTFIPQDGNADYNIEYFKAINDRYFN